MCISAVCSAPLLFAAYSAGEEKSPLFIFLHEQLPFFLEETVANFSKKSDIFSWKYLYFSLTF